jgi:hypothetical protein
VLSFQDAAPTPAGDWRHIVRFGRNVASYKLKFFLPNETEVLTPDAVMNRLRTPVSEPVRHLLW